MKQISLESKKSINMESKMMDYFVISRYHKNLTDAISKIFEETKDIKVIPDRRVDQNREYSGPERRKVNKIEKIS